jgi:hypothetical protein
VTTAPKYFCSKCHATKPPVFANHMYTCVICGKSRSTERFRDEMNSLRSMKAPRHLVRPAPVVRAASPVAKKAPVARPVTKAAPAANSAPAPRPASPAKAAPSAQAAPAAKPAAAKPASAAGATGTCAWVECSNPARPRSKYCSRGCSNKNARARHANRKT